MYGEFPNDYSHLFCYAAIVAYYAKLGKSPGDAEAERAFRLLRDQA